MEQISRQQVDFDSGVERRKNTPQQNDPPASKGVLYTTNADYFVQDKASVQVRVPGNFFPDVPLADNSAGYTSRRIGEVRSRSRSRGGLEVAPWVTPGGTKSLPALSVERHVYEAATGSYVNVR